MKTTFPNHLVRRCFLLLGLCFILFVGSMVQAQVVFQTVRRIEVGPAWSGHPVGFALLTQGDQQFIAYYDAEQNLTLGQRRLDEKSWTFQRLPTKIGWDSHNYVTMTFDRDQCLHVSGNMHCVPLIYFRSDKPLDIMSLRKIPQMTGVDEQRCTYPHFITGPERNLLFTYRDGGSGNGVQIWNQYDPASKTWSRLFEKPMFDGQGKMNAYFNGPLLGPDGFYHISWMWRDTPDCATNHDLSYARSRDLKHWENSRGEPMTLPITLQTGEIIDAAQPGEGLLNPCQKLGFDLQGRVVLSYAKYDKDGYFQAYHARLESGVWTYYQTSDWKYRWEFKGNGTIISEVSLGPLEIQNGKLVQSYSHIKEGGGRWELDEDTLKPIGKAPSPVRWPHEIGKIELEFPGLQSRTAWDIRDSGRPIGTEPETRFVMKWETQSTNRDRPHPETPPPTLLRIFELKNIAE